MPVLLNFLSGYDIIYIKYNFIRKVVMYMTCEGIVCEIKDNKTYVYVPRESACGGNCASCSACSERKNKVEALNNIGAEKGDRVTVYMPTLKLMGYAFSVYLLPVFLVLLLVTLADAYFKSIAVNVSVAIACIVIWLITIKLINKNAKFKNEIISIKKASP